MKKIIIIILIVYTSNIYSQEILILDSCIETTINNYPIFKDKALNKKISDLSIKNNKAFFLPSLFFEGKATYQSDVFKLDVELPNIPGFEINFPEPPADQYDFSFNILQLIYDGGSIKNLNFIEQKKLLAEQKRTDIELYKLKEQVEKTFFSILILQKTKKQLTLAIQELQKKKNALTSAIKNGILTQDNSDILQVEIYKLAQSLIEVEENKKSGINILQELMSVNLQNNIKLELPKDIKINKSDSSKTRPEIELFSMQNDILKANEKSLQSNRLPKLGAFAKGGYGNPGLTMVNDEWNPYFIIGAKLTWNIWDRNITKRNKDILKINSELIETKKNTFKKNINIESYRQLSNISKLNKLIINDNAILKLQNNICKKASSKLDNGIITSIDYIKLINDKTRTKIKSEIHKIKLSQAIRNYNRIQGN